MMNFSRKPVRSIEPLGEKLRTARLSCHLSVETAALKTSIPSKYLYALEESRYQDLPGDVYVRNFLRSYAALLHLTLDRVMALYEGERRVMSTLTHKPSPPKELPSIRSVHLPKLLKRVGIFAGVLGLLVYLGLKVENIVEPPPLNVSAPISDLVTKEFALVVAGDTAAESTVRINGQEVFLDTTGHFSERIDLQPGLNVIKVSSRKERSKEQVVYRQVIVEDTSPSAATTTPTESHP